MRRALVLGIFICLSVSLLFANGSFEYKAIYVKNGERVDFSYPVTVYPKENGAVNSKVCIGYALSQEDADRIAQGRLPESELVPFPYVNSTGKDIYLYPAMVDYLEIADVYSDGDDIILQGLNENGRYGLDNIMYLGIPKELNEIGRRSMEDQNIKAVAFEDGSELDKISEGAFSKVETLTYIDLENTHLEEIGSWAFEKTGLESLVLPSTIKEIDSYAFEGTASLKSVVFLASSELDEIKEGAFKNSGLVSITLPRSLEKIDNYAFDNAAELKEVSFEPLSSLEEIGFRAFRGTGLERISIPQSVEKIGSSAFRGCPELREVTFQAGSNLEKVSSYAFADCPNLTAPVFPKNARISSTALNK